MDKFELTLIVAFALLVSFVIGWILSRLFRNINQNTHLEESDVNELTTTLLNVEEERDNTIAYVQNREKELANQLGQVKAELNAAMDGLGSARREVAELKEKLLSQE
jgi:archaellum component FlaC|tara:strand:- start:1123 stop:1443 length:321 start_codon:yes stop_codon:yes gene_type:complete